MAPSREAAEFRKTKLCATKCRGKDGVGSAEPRRLRFCGFSLVAAHLSSSPTASLQRTTAARATLPPRICASVERARTKTMATTNNKRNRGARFAAFFSRISNRYNKLLELPVSYTKQKLAVISNRYKNTLSHFRLFVTFADDAARGTN